MFLISLAKSLPRRASTTAFLCLVVAHLEWPDIGLGLLHDVEEQAMHTQVAGELGVEGRREQRTLPDSDDPTGGRAGGRAGGDSREDVDAGAGFLDPRRPDEHGVQRGPVAEHADVEIGLERLDLPAERVAPDGYVQSAKGALVRGAVDDPIREHDHAGARAVHRRPALDPLAQRLVEVERADQLVHRGGLTTGDDHGVDAFQLDRPAYRTGGNAARLQRGKV